MRLLVIISLMLLSMAASAQNLPVQTLGNATNRVQARGQFGIDSLGFMAVRSDTISVTGQSDKLGAIIYVPQYAGYFMRDTVTGSHRWIKLLKTGDAITGVNNGLSASGTLGQLGQPVGGSGATLLNSREIPMSDSSIYFRNGIFNITADHRVDVSHPIFRVSSTSTLFHEMAEFRAKFVQETWFRSDSTDGYTGLGFALAGTQYLGIGVDGVADHTYWQIKNGFDFWIENSSSSVMAAFEEDGDISLVVNGPERRLGIGVTTPTYRIDANGAKTGVTSSDRIFNLNDAGTTYSTAGGALTNTLAYLQSTATKTGANPLTNIGLYIRTAFADVNHAIFVDTPSTVVVGLFSNTTAWANFVHLQDVANTSSTQKTADMQVTRSMRYSDNDAGTEQSSHALYASSTYRPRVSITIPNNQTGGAVEAALFFRRNTAYTGPTTIQGSVLPSNNVTTMPSALNARLDASQAQTGGNSIVSRGWFAAFSSAVNISTGNTLDTAVWINTGAGQFNNGGSIISAYGIYITAMPSIATNKYAAYQEGSADSIYIGGITRHANIVQQTDTTSYKPMAVDSKGIVYKMASWPAGGGMAIGGTITGATQGSVLFAGASGVLAQDNAAFFYTDANNALYVDSVRSLLVQAPIVVGGTGTTDDLILRTTKGAGTTGSDIIFQGGNNGATEFARFLNSGNFGVGVTNPTSTIHSGGDIKSNAAVLWGNIGNGRLTYSGNDAYIDAAVASGALFFRTNATATQVMKMLSSGRVLIGSVTDRGDYLIQNAGNTYLGQSVSYKVSNITTNTTIDLTYYYITVDATGGAVTITLPAASTATSNGVGVHYIFKRLDASGNTITISRAGSDTIDGATSFTLVAQWETKELTCLSSSTWGLN